MRWNLFDGDVKIFVVVLGTFLRFTEMFTITWKRQMNDVTVKIRAEQTVENPFATAMIMADIRGARFHGPGFWQREFL